MMALDILQPAGWSVVPALSCHEAVSVSQAVICLMSHVRVTTL